MMSEFQKKDLPPLIERARKVLQHEQRTNHQDQVVKPGGLESFAVRWAEDTANAYAGSVEDASQIQRFSELLKGYHEQDPIQRAAQLRAALVYLNNLESPNQETPEQARQDHSTPQAQETRRPTAPRQSRAATNGNGTGGKPATSPKMDINVTTGRSKSSPARETAAGVKPDPRAQSPSAPNHNPVRLEAGMSHGHTSLTLLTADITAIPGVGPSSANRLRSLGVNTIRDLLYYFPREHRDYGNLVKIADLPMNELTTTMGLIWEVESARTAKGRTRTIATISDETGKLRVSWFNQPYLQKQLNTAKGSYLVVTGLKQRFGNKLEFSVRSHELPEQGDLLNTGRLVPVYPLTEGLHAKALRRYIKWAVDKYAGMLPDHLPESVRANENLMVLSTAVSQIHYPDSKELLDEARRRLAFDELFIMQLGMQEKRSRWKHESPRGNAFTIDPERIFVEVPPGFQFGQRGSKTKKIPTVSAAIAPSSSTLWSTIASDKPFEGTLPFTFTDAQKRVICEIFEDLVQDQPMNRLLQGDVGSGKTAVASAALYAAALNGYQSAIMAPTEILAEQHARGITAMLEPFGIRTVLLTGSQRSRERAAARTALESGQAMVAIGTHALIQDDVNFQSLGLVIIDEQHRFGVEQRDALRKKGYHPHMLVMTATPIPRTLSLTLYGDLDVSVIDQLPPGRQKITTRWLTGARREEANYLIAQQVAEGRQAFIICPLIEESESLSAKAATVEYERLSRIVFPNLRLGLVHGAMKAAEKDLVMHQFRDHSMDILVATSVIEVGIDIPNASVMVIEDADRFGLSQLHQFRGRVGRGRHKSYCFVLSADASLQSQERLQIFQETDDGFLLAEQDLRLRGPGDFFGVRQSGVPELKIADLGNTRLIEEARNQAIRLWGEDPYLRQPEHTPLRERVHLFWSTFIAN